MLRFARRRLLSRDRYVDALLVIEAHTGEELLRVGGCWDMHAERYVDRPVQARVVRLEESQLELGRALARWIADRQAARRRARAIVAGGPRGSGKTWCMAGVFFAVMALAFPGEWMFGINLTLKQKRECIEAIEAVVDAKWIAGEVNDFRDPQLQFLTGATISWKSAQNPRAIREAGLRISYILINEGQDQPEIVFINAISAIRNCGALLGIATNPPREDRSDWVAAVWEGIEAGRLNGERYFVDNKKNRSIDQASLGDIAEFIRTVNREAAEADADGVFKLSGPIAYPAFRALPRERGGHVGAPPIVQVGRGWADVTREISAAAVESQAGYDFVVGVDFQRLPGCIGVIAKLYRDERGRIILHVIDIVAVRGVEPDFSQGLIAAGYFPAHGMGGPTALLVGDATGARQNAEHRFAQPPSFTALRADGWKIVPPMYHWRRGTPWNPMVRDSRAQMHGLLEQHQILLSERCAEPADGFPSLIESFRRAKVGPRGGLIELGQYQHGPDGVRYLAWRFLPRPKPQTPAPTLDEQTLDKVRGVKIFGS